MTNRKNAGKVKLKMQSQNVAVYCKPQNDGPNIFIVILCKNKL